MFDAGAAVPARVASKAPTEQDAPGTPVEEPGEDSASAVPERVPEELADLPLVLAELEAKLATWAVGVAEACARFVDPDGLLDVAGPDCLTDPWRGLRPWLTDLEAAAQEGRLADVEVGIRAWQEQAAQVSAAADQLIAANSAPYEYLVELRGRLNSYLAMAGNSWLVEDEALADLHTRALGTLHHVPTDLRLADRLVGEYTRELNARRDQGGAR